MCIDPGSLAIITAIGSAVAGSVQSIASYTQAQQETNYANAVAQQQYQMQQQAYAQSERAYTQQVEQINLAANRVYESKQKELSAEYRKASEEANQRMVKSLQQQGTILSSGRSGQSIGILISDAERTAGRDFALLGQNLAYANEDYFYGAQSVFNEAQSSMNVAASNRMLAPTAPIMQQGPSGLGLVAGIGGSVMSAASTFGSLKAPKANVPNPPTPRSPNMPGIPGSTASTGKPYYGPAF